MKKLLLITLILAFFNSSYGQKVKLQNNKILVDKVELLSYEKGGTYGAVEYELSELISGNRIILLVQYNNGTQSVMTDDYIGIKFLTKGTNAEINGADIRNAVKLLMKNEVLRADGTLDEEKIELFIKNYDENISDKTIIIKG